LLYHLSLTEVRMYRHGQLTIESQMSQVFEP
jgi:hypothetical protein